MAETWSDRKFELRPSLGVIMCERLLGRELRALADRPCPQDICASSRSKGDSGRLLRSEGESSRQQSRCWRQQASDAPSFDHASPAPTSDTAA